MRVLRFREQIFLGTAELLAIVMHACCVILEQKLTELSSSVVLDRLYRTFSSDKLL